MVVETRRLNGITTGESREKNNSLCNTAHNHENLVFVSAALWSGWCLAEVGRDQLDVVDCFPAGLGSRFGVLAPKKHSCRAGPGEHALNTQATERGSSSPTARLSICKDWGVDPEPTAGMGPKETSTGGLQACSLVFDSLIALLPLVYHSGEATV